MPIWRPHVYRIEKIPNMMMSPSPVTMEQLQKRIDSLQQANKVLIVELDTYKLRVVKLQEENKTLRQESVNIQAKAEQEEEYISNTLLKKIQALKKEKETLALNYEQEEECLTNDLSRKLNQLQQEKVQLEHTLEQEQEVLVSKLMRKIEKLQAETASKQANLEQLQREKVELENTLEQEQEALVNKLWKRMDKLEGEKRMLQEKLEQPISAPPSPREMNHDGNTASNLTFHIGHLRNEVAKLKSQLKSAQQEHSQKMAQFALEEKQVREENLRLQRKLQIEMERRESLCRHLSESESSLEMDEERHFNEMALQGHNVRQRAISSPIPYSPSPNPTYPMSPVGPSVRDNFNPPSPMNRCLSCGQSLVHSSTNLPSSSPPHTQSSLSVRYNSDRFIKPAVPRSCSPSTVQPMMTSPVPSPSPSPSSSNSNLQGSG